jgi:hypothetical protein
MRAAIRQPSDMVIQTFSISTMSLTAVSTMRVRASRLAYAAAHLYPPRRRRETRRGEARSCPPAGIGRMLAMAWIRL